MAPGLLACAYATGDDSAQPQRGGGGQLLPSPQRCSGGGGGADLSRSSSRRSSESGTPRSCAATPTAVISGVLYEHPPGRFAKKRRRRFTLRGAFLEARPVDVPVASDPADMYNLGLAQMGPRSGLQFTVKGPHLPGGALELSAHDDPALYRWTVAIERQLALPCCAGAAYAVRRQELVSDRCRNLADGVAVRKRVVGRMAGTLDRAAGVAAAAAAATPAPAPPQRPRTRPSTVVCSFCTYSFSPSEPGCPMCGEERPADDGPWEGDEAGGEDPDTVVVEKLADEAMGLAWEDDTRITWVVGSSPADRCGLSRFIGRRVTHINGRPVTHFEGLKQLIADQTSVRFRFEPAESAGLDGLTDIDDAVELEGAHHVDVTTPVQHRSPAPPPPPATVTVARLSTCPAEVVFQTAKGGDVCVSAGAAGTLAVSYNGEPDPPCSQVCVEVEDGKVELFLGSPTQAAPFRLPVAAAGRILAEVRAVAMANRVECLIPDRIDLATPCKQPNAAAPAPALLSPTLLGAPAVPSAAALPPRPPPAPPADDQSPETDKSSRQQREELVSEGLLTVSASSSPRMSPPESSPRLGGTQKTLPQGHGLLCVDAGHLDPEPGPADAEDEARLRVMALSTDEMRAAISEAGGVGGWNKLTWQRRWSCHSRLRREAEEDPPALVFTGQVTVRHGPKWEGSLREEAGPHEMVVSESVLGQRVRRNCPDWEYGDQDGGEGALGTVVLVGQEEVTVRWDVGGTHIYRWGFGGKWDVKIADGDEDAPKTARELELSKSLAEAQRRAEELERRCDQRSDFAAALIQERDGERRRALEYERSAAEAKLRLQALRNSADIVVM
eukprot:TRINITY_DN8484_c0_g1_i2.p1 TRINITY_DN8484_c0_g1~~TRINITY_DN8484_c0_g1_i2.p1  ORF type:complete len:868 (+),score=330.03 TRINITY_DN8484_c0_g1_i2:88-2604(+)